MSRFPMQIVVAVEPYLVAASLALYCREQRSGMAATCCRSRTDLESHLATAPCDCLLVSPDLADADGFDVAVSARAHHPHLPIVIVALHTDEYTLWRMERHGLRTLVDGAAESLEGLGEALAAVDEGRPLPSACFAAARQAWRDDPLAIAKRLTDRACELLPFFGPALGDAEIGARLGMSAATVKWHRGEILRRLSLVSTAQLIRVATTRGWVRPHTPG